MRLLVCVLLALLLETTGQARRSADPEVSDLSWLTGCWSLTRPNGGEVEEHWMAPKGGTMLGMSRTVRDGKTVEHEFLQIRLDGTTLVYNAWPSGQAPAVFPLKALEPDSVTFENPSHDFPQRVIYRRTASGIAARVEGTANGKTRGVDFSYVRCNG
jgi:hypothetical protein